mgnify:CR=1 FL=1
MRKMDIYSSSLDIPFNVAAYCRGHRLSIEAVNLSRAIQQRESAKALVAQAERLLEEKESALRAALQDVNAKMQRDPL